MAESPNPYRPPTAAMTDQAAEKAKPSVRSDISLQIAFIAFSGGMLGFIATIDLRPLIPGLPGPIAGALTGAVLCQLVWYLIVRCRIQLSQDPKDS